MNAPHITSHAVSRYRLRAAPVSEAEAREALRCPAVQAAAAIGARYVRLPTGQRIVIENGAVVTVLPAGRGAPKR